MRTFGILVVVCVTGVGGAAYLEGTGGIPVKALVGVQGVALSGTIVDPAGTPVPGVSVELWRGKAVQKRTVTDRAGTWRFDGVAPGGYEMRASLQGFATSLLQIQVRDRAVAGLTITMKAGAVSETVTARVSGEAAVVGEAPTRSVTLGVPGAVVGGVAGRLPSAPQGVAAPPGPPVQDALASRSLHHIERPDTSSYAAIHENTFRRVTEHPLSTFSADVDTASYANVRRFLNEGRLPPADAVRLEEMINYFKYDYPAPKGDAPFAIATEFAVTPWNPRTRLALIGLRARPLPQERTPPRNLTFLLDVSGSMMPPNRLPLVKTAMQMLADTLRPEDKVSIVVYAGSSGTVLKPTSGAHRADIRRAIEQLHAGGSTNGAAGIRLAYDLAAENFVKEGINRVILATDGDFNVGVTSRTELTRLIEQQRERGIFLSVLGVGDDNLQDSTMEMLADTGNGNYSYLDSLQEARRVLIAEAGSTLVAVAKDVKLQVEFNPRVVAAYRLVGYENRVMRKEDFNNDRKDAGEVGAGHMVTALYEIVPAGETVPGADVDPLKYQPQPPAPAAPVAPNSTEMMTVKVRYKAPDGDASRLLEVPVRNGAPRMTQNIGFAAAVAEFGLLLRQSEFRGNASWQETAALARSHRGEDPDGYRAEFLRLVDIAQALGAKRSTTDAPYNR